MKCDQCQLLFINGIACHEFRCPNTWKTWFKDRQQWIQILKCFHCGCPFEESTLCGCREQGETQ
jgi:hypothetical protein